MRNTLTVVLCFVALLLAIIVYNLFAPGPAPRVLAGMSYSDFIHAVDAGHIRSVTIQGSILSASDDDNRPTQVILPADDAALLPRLLAKDVRIAIRSVEEPFSLLRVIVNWLPFLMLLTVFGLGMRQMIRTTKALGETTQALLAALATRDREERR